MSAIDELMVKFSKIRLDNVDVERDRIGNELINEAAIKYSNELNIDKKTALLAIKEILPSKLEVDPTLKGLDSNVKRMMGAVRLLAPKLQGLENREGDIKLVVRSLKTTVSDNTNIVKALDLRVELLNEITTTLIKINLDSYNNYYRIPKLSFLFNGLIEKVKCLLSKKKK